MKFSAFAVVALVATLTGCAASGPKHAEVASTFPTLAADQGRVYFYRPNSMMGAALQPSIKLDGVVVGESKPGGFFYVDTTAGAHEASTSTETENKLSFVVDKGEVKYVRTRVSMGVLVGHVTPVLVNTTEGSAEIAETSYTGKPVK
ncbi:MAG: DUF2846 domain-containing protein [Massilia sp.]